MQHKHITKQEHQAIKQANSKHPQHSYIKQTMAAILRVQLMKHSHGLTLLELGCPINVNQEGHEVVVDGAANLNSELFQLDAMCDARWWTSSLASS